MVNIIQEVRNSAGEVDVDIHDEEEKGQSHTLVIRQESFRGEDNVRYSFSHGRCIVRSVPLPRSEGLFSFVASHSRFHELQTSIKVRVEKAVNSEHDITQPRSQKEEVMVVYDHPCNEFSDGSIMRYNDSRALVDLEDSLQNQLNHVENKLVDDICKYGLRTTECELNLRALYVEQSNILLEMSNLEANIGPDSLKNLGLNKDMVVQRIEEKADSAAAVVHKLLKSPKSEHLHLDLVNDILGVVALLGEVKNHKLSSMFSAYIGEDQMLAIVCKSHAAARTLEKYQMDGNVKCAIPLEILETNLGNSVNGHYLVICLEDIRPYTGRVRSDRQRELAIAGPTFSKEEPAGFLGYAVNMVLLSAEHLQLRTASGYGLRETLFYRLLGKLQVYESREHLYRASSFIEDGAVSLDGGMMRGNGVVSVGYVEPYILFPVPLSTEQVDILRRIEEKKLELSETEGKIKEENNAYAKYKKLDEKLEYKKQLEESSPLPGMYSSDMDISNSG